MSYAGKQKSDEDAQRLNDSLCYLLNKNAKGIIVDLRLNGGGNMYPMMLGLQQLQGEEKIGSFIAGKQESWYIKDNNFLLDTTMLASIVPKCTVNAQNLPVVVLIGRGTGSSGEFLTMSLKGRNNTKFIGTKTAGYVTVISGIPINEAAYLYLSTGYGEDRKGNMYKDPIEPDVTLETPDSFNDIENDEKVKAGIKWITPHSR
jgi:carboxyl-terminal processing protease